MASRSRQRGQVVVLFAVGIVALVSMVGLVLMAGLLYWDQRQLQTLADGSALAGATGVTSADCSTNGSAPITSADEFLQQQFGTATTALSVSGSCSTAYVGTASYSCFSTSCAVTYTYPWNSKQYEVAVSIKRSGITLQFGALLGTSTVNNLVGRAVAQHNFARLPSAFALYAQNGIECAGSGVKTPSPKILVNGSIYSGSTITPTGNCAVYAQDTVGFDGTEDYGDILVYTDGEPWASGGSSCVGTPENSVCADGFELSGHTSPTCGNNVGTTPQTEYLKDSTSTVPDPCGGVPPPVPLLAEANYAGTDPNTDAVIAANAGGPCSYTAGATPGGTSVQLITSSKKYGWGPTPTQNGSVEQFVPGCYGYLDIGTFLKNAPAGVTSVKLEPGFYFFNGYDCNSDNSSGCSASSGGGLCLYGGGTKDIILTATDVLLEFVNSTSFSTSSCAANPSSACGTSACDFGTSISAPSAPSTAISTPGTNLPAGTYSFEITYRDSQTGGFGETTASSAATAALALGGQVVLTAGSVPVEATSVGFYLTGCSGASFPSGTCSSGGVNPGFLGSSTVTGGTATLTFSGATQGNYVAVPSTNTASIWFAAPPTSPEPAPPAPTVNAQTGTETNLPAGSYAVQATYRDPEGETVGGSTSTATLNGSQVLQLQEGGASQGVSTIAFYLTSAPAGVTTGYIGQVAAPVGSTVIMYLTSASQGNGTAAPASNTTSSSWCSASKAGWTSTDAAVCANQLLWAPPSGMTGGQISGRFYVKGSNENSAIMGDIYWPGPAGASLTSSSAGCNYDANGVGGLLGQVICDTLYVQGGAAAGSATIGWTTGAKYSEPPEISLVE